MKSMEKRVNTLCADMPPVSRAAAILDSVAANDMALCGSLLASTPMKSYRCTDMEVGNTVTAAHDLSLRFDRGFFRIVAGMTAAMMFRDRSAKDGKERGKFEAAVTMYEDDLCALISGAEVFAESVGLSLRRLLAFSQAMDDGHVEHFRIPLDQLSDDDRANADEVAAAFRELWTRDRFTISSFGGN